MDYWEQPYQPQRTRFHMFGPRRGLSPGVKWLIIISVAVFFLEILIVAPARGVVGGASERFMRVFGPLVLSPADVFGKGYIWQLVTYAFLHDPGSIFHILFNMLFLYWFGRDIENVWGTKKFVLFYLGGAAFSGLVFSLVHIYLDVSYCIGASGAIMAVMMVFSLWFPNQIILFMLFFPMRIRTFIMLLIGIETLSFLQANSRSANMAHLGGLLFGYLTVRFAPLLGRLAGRFASGRRESAVDDERRLDEILNKIRLEGMGSLSWSERRFLKRISRHR